MKIIRCILVWSCAATALCGCGEPGISTSGDKTVEEPVETNLDAAVLLDVRSADEYASGHLQGARNIPHDRIAAEIVAAVPDKTAVVILYCRSGRRAETAMKAMRDLGYENVSNFGGLEDAQERLGLPVVR